MHFMSLSKKELIVIISVVFVACLAIAYLIAESNKYDKQHEAELAQLGYNQWVDFSFFDEVKSETSDSSACLIVGKDNPCFSENGDTFSKENPPKSGLIFFKCNNSEKRQLNYEKLFVIDSIVNNPEESGAYIEVDSSMNSLYPKTIKLRLTYQQLAEVKE